jgi:hypothetical protein
MQRLSDRSGYRAIPLGDGSDCGVKIAVDVACLGFKVGHGYG